MSNEFFTPQSRNEAILQNICGANNVLPEPQSRIEKLLQAILYEDATIVDFTPESRAELLLYAILTHGVYDAEPQSQNETILKAILTNGEYDALPQSRIEALLIEWLDQTHYEEKTVSGDVVSINDAVDAPVADLTAAIVPVQSGSGDPYPPGGGKNLLNPYEVITQRYIKNNGDVLSSPGWSVSGYIRVTAGSTYVLNIQNTGTAAYHAFYDANKEFVSSVISTTSPITIPSGVFYIRLSMRTVDPATAQFELGSTSTAFAPYSNIRPISGWTECKVYRSGADTSDPTIYTVTFGSAGTVYGGTLDVTTGTLTVDKAMVDLGTLTWSAAGSTGVLITSDGLKNLIKIPPSDGIAVNAISDTYVVVQNNASKSVGNLSCSQSGYIFIKVEDNTSYTVTGNLVYELATPIVYDLTPVEIRTLAGQNNIWADTGGVTVTYKAQRTAAALMMMAGRF